MKAWVLAQRGVRFFIFVPYWLYFTVLHGARVRGKHHLPSRGAALLVPNHQSFYDGQLISSRAGRPNFFLVWKRYLKVPGIGLALRLLGAVPVEDSRNRAAAPYRAALKLLRQGQCVMVFPEARRTSDGRLQPLREGAARIAQTADAPLIPVSIVGAFEAWPRGRRLPRPFRPIVLEFHRPIIPESGDRDEARRWAKEATHEVARILGRRTEAWRRLRSR